MTLKQLEAFYWAAKLGTFVIAAERLHLTQSSLSKRISELEAAIGHPLFDRSSKRLLLTQAGHQLLERAQQMLDLVSSIHTDFSREQTVGGRWRMGLGELSATTWFPALLGRARNDYPKLQIEPTVGLGRNLERLVERGELDFAVIAGEAFGSEVGSTSIATVEFAWMASPQRLRRGTLLQAQHFKEHPVISSTQDSGTTRSFEKWVGQQKLKIGQIIPCNSLTAIINLTAAGLGIGHLPKLYVAPLVERKLLVPLRCEAALPALHYSLVWRKEDDRRFLELAKRLIVEEVDFGVANRLWA